MYGIVTKAHSEQHAYERRVTSFGLDALLAPYLANAAGTLPQPRDGRANEALHASHTA